MLCYKDIYVLVHLSQSPLNADRNENQIGCNRPYIPDSKDTHSNILVHVNCTSISVRVLNVEKEQSKKKDA